MASAGHKWWLGATIGLTVILLITVFPLLQAKYGTPAAVLLSGLLTAGMALYWLRGVLISRSGK